MSEKFHRPGSRIYVFVPPRTMRIYYINSDGSLKEVNAAPTVPTIKTPVEVDPAEALKPRTVTRKLGWYQ